MSQSLFKKSDRLGTASINAAGDSVVSQPAGSGVEWGVVPLLAGKSAWLTGGAATRAGRGRHPGRPALRQQQRLLPQQ